MTADDPLLGRTLAGRYRLISHLGRGAMSTVYLARHVLIERLSAIKVLHDALSGDQHYADRFLREARAVNRINHANIVEITDYGEVMVAVAHRDDRRKIVYLVMEYVPGESLRRVLERGTLPPARLLPIAVQITSALSRAHQTGVIHRDVKPDNVLLQPRRDGGDLAKLTDFGVAKMARGPATEGGDQVFGTPGYIAPEYLLGEASIDGRADLYSLGVVMYEALTGTLPFDWRSTTDLLTLPMTEEPIPLRTRDPKLPTAVETVVMRCLRSRPDDRPRDAFALLDDLQAAALSVGVRLVEGSLPPGPRRDSLSAPSSGGLPRTTASYGSQAAQAIQQAGLIVVQEEEEDDEPTQEHARLPTMPPEAPAPTPTPTPVPPPPMPSMPPPPSMDGGPNALIDAWQTHLAALDARLAPRLDGRPLPPDVSVAQERGRTLLDTLARTVMLVVETQNTLDGLGERARDFRKTLGRAVDHVARELSRTHARVIELKSRRVQLHLARRNCRDPGKADALLWEEAAVDDDLRRTFATSQDLGHQLGALQDELFARNNAHEEEVLRTTGLLEGELAAAATLHRELELLSTEVRRFLRG